MFDNNKMFQGNPYLQQWNCRSGIVVAKSSRSFARGMQFNRQHQTILLAASLDHKILWKQHSMQLSNSMPINKDMMKCHVTLSEQEFVKLAQNDKLVTCPNLVKVTQQVEAAAKCLPYESGRQYTFDMTKANEIFGYLKKSGHIKLPQGHRVLTVAEIASKDYWLLRFPEKPKEAIGVDENPFPIIDVGVNVVDIRTIFGRMYKGRTLAAGDQLWLQGRMVWKRKESQEVAVQNESQPEVPPPKLTSLIVNENELKATFEADQQTKLTSDDNLFKDMDVLESTHVPTHVSKGSMVVEEEVIEVPAHEEEEEHDIFSEQIIFNKSNESVTRHIKPLYISAHMDGVPVNRVLVDNGAAVNVIPSFILRNLGKNSEDLVYTDITISDFTGGISKSKGVLLVALTVGNKTLVSAFFVVDSSATYNALLGRKTEVVYADNRPFLANSNMVEARYYDEDVGTIRFFSIDRQGRPCGITNKPTLAKYVVDEVVHEGEANTHTDGVTMEELDLALVKLDDLKADVQDPLKEVNLGTKEFDDFSLKHIPHMMNVEANELAQIASGVKMLEGILKKVIVIEKRMLPSVHQRGITMEACSLNVTPTDSRHPIIKHLRNPSSKTSRRTRMQALNYVLLGDVLYRKGQDELLLRCLGLDKSCHVMSDVHNGICGAHQAWIKMRWLIQRHDFFWPSILKDCINYAKGCRACQLHSPLQRALASELHPIVKPWPFCGWAIDLIGKFSPPSSKGHSFIIVAIDYFTKWVEARLMKKVEQADVIKFIKEDLI
ncbi:hypothetical protein SLEP1_g3857 [Rubroshorea leprosula]|uniref:Integrase catalytic domain-containing protein n=1 Tax=Rubroshorea leprosula TaxID=152421 RepID=A0AAV5HVN7_9ROSI|nr:hypothetical protein SLEP1_g3857 [Rubroshorea leprosula]